MTFEVNPTQVTSIGESCWPLQRQVTLWFWNIHNGRNLLRWGQSIPREIVFLSISHDNWMWRHFSLMHALWYRASVLTGEDDQ